MRARAATAEDGQAVVRLWAAEGSTPDLRARRVQGLLERVCSLSNLPHDLALAARSLKGACGLDSEQLRSACDGVPLAKGALQRVVDWVAANPAIAGDWDALHSPVSGMLSGDGRDALRHVVAALAAHSMACPTGVRVPGYCCGTAVTTCRACGAGMCAEAQPRAPYMTAVELRHNEEAAAAAAAAAADAAAAVNVAAVTTATATHWSAAGRRPQALSWTDRSHGPGLGASLQCACCMPAASRLASVTLPVQRR